MIMTIEYKIGIQYYHEKYKGTNSVVLQDKNASFALSHPIIPKRTPMSDFEE